MIELLQAMGLDDASSLAWGLVLGATMAALWVSAWFVGESVVNRLLEPGFTAHTDDALELTREQEVAS